MSDLSRERTVFEELSVPKAVLTLAIPSVITQLINIVYNFADTFYVGRTNNPAMVAALSVSMPVFIIMGAIANLFGIGGSSVISRSLGMKRPEKARRVFAFCFFGGMIAAVIYMLVILLFRAHFIPVVGGDADSFPYIYDYMFWTMGVGAIPTVGNVLCGHLVRSTGASKQAGFGMSMGGILNIALDPLFMFVIMPKGQEVCGAAIATMLSNTAAFLYFLIYLMRHRDNPVYTISPKDISVAERIPGDVFAIGIPAALSTTCAMISNMCANALVKEFGNAAVAGMGVSRKVYMLSFNTSLGLTQGVLPLVGYTYGAKNFTRMRKSIVFTAGLTVLVGVICMIVFRSFSGELVSFFIREEASLSFGKQFLRIFSLAAPWTAFSYTMQMVFQATGYRINALVLSILRHGSLDILLMVLLKGVYGATGVLMATPIAEISAFAVALLLMFLFLRNIRREISSMEGGQVQ